MRTECQKLWKYAWFDQFWPFWGPYDFHNFGWSCQISGRVKIQKLSTSYWIFVYKYWCGKSKSSKDHYFWVKTHILPPLGGLSKTRGVVKIFLFWKGNVDKRCILGPDRSQRHSNNNNNDNNNNDIGLHKAIKRKERVTSGNKNVWENRKIFRKDSES